MEYSLTKATVVLNSTHILHQPIAIKGKRIAAVGKVEGIPIDLQNECIVYPALINIHDHLRGDYLPRVGPPEGTFYLNWSEWDKDLKTSRVFQERANISLMDSYLLGAYKNLFSGVCTVNDHFPHEFNEPFLDKLPIRVIREYALAHECSSFDLKWGDGIVTEHRRALKRGHPFITHLEEGFDEESQQGIEILLETGSLDEHAVLIHCIGFSDEDIRRVRKAGAHVVWCPASNMFMFNVTCKIRKILRAGVNVSIGTDSTHTGSINLLEELRYARSLYRTMYGEDLPARTLFEMVTQNPAKALRREDSIGTLEIGKWADILVVKQIEEDPFETLLKMNLEDIELLVLAGIPILGSDRCIALFQKKEKDYTSIALKGCKRTVIGDPMALLQRVREKVGYPKVLDYMPLQG
ncbi:MAG: amidohydrolase family protein [Spirochaetes bacterium]|nr:amidohydrolase family protein [Spirochaetota bacterium]